MGFKSPTILRESQLSPRLPRAVQFIGRLRPRTDDAVNRGKAQIAAIRRASGNGHSIQRGHLVDDETSLSKTKVTGLNPVAPNFRHSGTKIGLRSRFGSSYALVESLGQPTAGADSEDRVVGKFECQSGKRSPNIGSPLTDWALVASSWSTSQCSASLPSSIRTMSAATKAAGRPLPEKRPCAIT